MSITWRLLWMTMESQFWRKTWWICWCSIRELVSWIIDLRYQLPKYIDCSSIRGQYAWPITLQDFVPSLTLLFTALGTSCLENSCKRKPIKFSPAPKENVSTLQCDCRSTGTAKCPAGAGGPRPSQWQSFTGDRLQNLTGRNMTDYLLKTYHNFIRKR